MITKRWFIKRYLALIFIFAFAVQGCATILQTRAASLPFPTTIASDCSQEVAIEIETWIRSVPDGSTIVFPANACYKTDRYIKLENRKDLIIDANNSIFKRFNLSSPDLSYPNPNPHWWLLGGEKIKFQNFRVEGTNVVSDVAKSPQYGSYKVSYEFEAAFRVERVTDSSFNNLTVDGVWGDGIQLQGGSKSIIKNSTITRNGRQGIGVINIGNVLIENVKILSSRRSAIDLENDLKDQKISNIEIRNSTFGSHLLTLPAGGPGAVDNVSFHHNIITTSGVPFISNYRANADAIRRFSWQVYNNEVKSSLGSPAPAIRMALTDNISIRDNVIPLASTQSRQAIYFQKAGGKLEVTGNHMENAQSAFVADTETGPVIACNNKLLITASFDQPIKCPINPQPISANPSQPITAPSPITTQRPPATTSSTTSKTTIIPKSTLTTATIDTGQDYDSQNQPISRPDLVKATTNTGLVNIDSEPQAEDSIFSFLASYIEIIKFRELFTNVALFLLALVLATISAVVWNRASNRVHARNFISAEAAIVIKPKFK